jgi:hypothetical protein
MKERFCQDDKIVVNVMDLIERTIIVSFIISIALGWIYLML